LHEFKGGEAVQVLLRLLYDINVEL